MEIEYRFAEEADIPRLIEINAGTEPEYLELNREMFGRLVPERRILCALTEGRIIAVLQFAREFLARPNLWYLEQITVDAAFRGKGIGRALIARLLAIAAAEGAEKAFADVHNDNYASLRMCIAAGGLISGTIEGVRSTQEKDERVIMRFELRGEA